MEPGPAFFPGPVSSYRYLIQDVSLATEIKGRVFKNETIEKYKGKSEENKTDARL